MLIILMGVSGSGKTVVGRQLASELGLPFIDGDDLHPPENVRKMSAKQPLTDQDRTPWLAAICEAAEAAFQQGQSIVIACSALKAAYRSVLRSVSQPLMILYLKGDPELIHQRLKTRAQQEQHFMPVDLLQSQFQVLEDPANEPGVIVIDIDQPLPAIVSAAAKAVQNRSGNRRSGG